MARPLANPARQQERAHRILDATSELIQRFGYDKTTIDDIARAAGVAKGTIYLHWNTRDALFAALLRRERVHLLEDVRRGAPSTLYDLLHGLAAGLLRRPLMRASLLGDSAVLGKLTRHKRESSATLPMGELFETYIGTLREHGALRADLTISEHLTVFTSTLYGFLTVRRYLPDSMQVPDERLAELLADTCRRALEADGAAHAGRHAGKPGGAADAGRRVGEPGGAADAAVVAKATQEYLDAAVAVAQNRLRASLGTKEYAT
ncbi:helix-turn-helix domain-containing protein [Nonomuraea sp. bgisy101]|uniref:TetR/AcrR family transcriptional regulator n=1 Tax=Nonomuraea sp. bgisy101 TaxID=3413784 RepID=UPI003D70355F